MPTDDLRRALERYHRDCFGWALACCERDRAEAEDVLQTAYLKVLDGRARFDGRSALRTWLFGVIRRTAAEHRRRRLADLRAGALSTVERLPVEIPAVDRQLDEGRRNDVLLAALALLAPRQREVLHLVFYHDLTIEDAAGVMQVSLGTARTHYERGKERLRARLAGIPR